MRNPNTKCDVCNKPIYKRPKDIKRTNANYCSHTCYASTLRKDRFCSVCKTKLPVGKRTKTCSAKCLEQSYLDPNRKYSVGKKSGTSKKVTTRSFKIRFHKSRGGACEICGYDKIDNLVIHHVIEKSQGGTDDLSNLKSICPNCHGEIHNKIEGPALESQAIC